MKALKNTFLLLLFLFFLANTLHGQVHENSIDIGYNIHHFETTGWKNSIAVCLGYNRQLKDNLGISVSSEFYFSEFYPEGEIPLETVFDRSFISFDTRINYAINLNDRSNLVFETGPVYRIGSENRVKKIIVYDIWTELIIQEMKLDALGVVLAANYQFHFSERWKLSSEIGLRRFYKAEISPFDLYGSLQIGFLF